MSLFLPIGERLKEERDRLGLNQTDFAAIGGIGRKTQFNYESGERAPDGAYLAAIATAGADVLYILTGQRVGAAAPVAPLKPDETALLDNYRNSPEEQQRLLRETSAAFAQRIKGKRSA
ncbi:MAG: transcriptional regulator [Hydrogenophilales bacterium CG17_big_fil_post_rev_8_21_14_2_50_63_12]|nr:MAG: transcriptional regulator [Hydrogenophilales bacterium CG17_big_fil_post_rev_8_21_14_2_50_63_12]PIX97031.1 MAG: transcriptional regulator [Hydrogenophilales bacterium CG_4_10_14_3_um_filter_63_21]PJB02335.1 MAG: transcriptional regulator [Hydrogenophilales bacterium CG_4_9_14_3_um_filter_63_34]